MLFKRIDPEDELKKIIECYWIVEKSDSEPIQQKIIPDGFTELIFHYGDPYRISLHGKWELQSMNLLAGQISKHFFLENTGSSGVFGVKFKPTALTHLYTIPMSDFTDTVVPADRVLGSEIRILADSLRNVSGYENKVNLVNNYFHVLLGSKTINPLPVDRAVDLICESNGMVSIASLGEHVGISERQLQNQFKKYVGLTSKYFARIIRFNYIFQLIQDKHTWNDLAYEASYYDQSHFIRNFKDFTGENPTNYAFDEKNLANFFLRKKAME